MKKHYIKFTGNAKQGKKNKSNQTKNYAMTLFLNYVYPRLSYKTL